MRFSDGELFVIAFLVGIVGFGIGEVTEDAQQKYLCEGMGGKYIEHAYVNCEESGVVIDGDSYQICVLPNVTMVEGGRDSDGYHKPWVTKEEWCGG